MIEIDDPILILEQLPELRRRAEDDERKYCQLTRDIFTGSKGKRWLRMAMARHNFMGSVYASEDGYNPHAAAYRDGARAVFSEILNSSAQANPARGKKNPDDDDT